MFAQQSRVLNVPARRRVTVVAWPMLLRRAQSPQHLCVLRSALTTPPRRAQITTLTEYAALKPITTSVVACYIMSAHVSGGFSRGQLPWGCPALAWLRTWRRRHASERPVPWRQPRPRSDTLPSCLRALPRLSAPWQPSVTLRAWPVLCCAAPRSTWLRSKRPCWSWCRRSGPRRHPTSAWGVHLSCNAGWWRSGPRRLPTSALRRARSRRLAPPRVSAAPATGCAPHALRSARATLCVGAITGNALSLVRLLWWMRAGTRRGCRGRWTHPRRSCGRCVQRPD